MEFPLNNSFIYELFLQCELFILWVIIMTIQNQEITEYINESIDCKSQMASKIEPIIAKASQTMIDAIKAGNKIMICGNGGSAIDAQHMAAELVARFEIDRPGLAAIALTVDTAMITAWSNDLDYSDVFARQVQAIGKSGDILLSISTSGNSKNCIKAMEMASSKNIANIALLGRDGGKMKDGSDHSIIITHQRTSIIQECHIMVIHIICGLIERALYPGN